MFDFYFNLWKVRTHHIGGIEPWTSFDIGKTTEVIKIGCHAYLVDRDYFNDPTQWIKFHTYLVLTTKFWPSALIQLKKKKLRDGARVKKGSNCDSVQLPCRESNPGNWKRRNLLEFEPRVIANTMDWVGIWTQGPRFELRTLQTPWETQSGIEPCN